MFARDMKRISLEMTRPTVRRPAFSLIEVIMVMTIIAVIIGLALPGLLTAREGARRLQCLNNLRQVSLALANYEVKYGVLPPGVVNPTGPVHNQPDDFHIGWIISFLPEMEQRGLAQSIDTRLSVYDPINSKAAGPQIRTMICPADVRAGRVGGVGVSSYAACHHDVEAPIDVDNHGVFYLNSSIRHEDIPDGSSFTIFVGEKRIASQDLGWLSGTRATLRNTGTPLNAGSKREAPEPVGDLVGGFSSSHAGGGNFIFGDGSVRFLRDQINSQVYQHLGHRDDGELISQDAF
jgi:prepilin-type N-terminal cleavage/methylation domain-containing protein/prepilin-type processing-associated H-X9-DG protein